MTKTPDSKTATVFFPLSFERFFFGVSDCCHCCSWLLTFLPVCYSISRWLPQTFDILIKISLCYLSLRYFPWLEVATACWRQDRQTMSAAAGDSTLSKRRQKNIQHKVEWEANASNPVGITCPLTKCRDLFSLATNSVDLFNDVLGNVESLSKLQTNFHNFSLRLLDVGMSAWLLVLLYAGPHDTTAKLLEEVIIVILLIIM